MRQMTVTWIAISALMSACGPAKVTSGANQSRDSTPAYQLSVHLDLPLGVGTEALGLPVLKPGKISLLNSLSTIDGTLLSDKILAEE